MDKYEHFEKYNMLECYIESNKSNNVASNLYFERYPERRQPHSKIFRRLEDNLINFGAFDKKRSTSYVKENAEDREISVLASVAANPATSSREIQTDLGVSRTTSLRILKKHKFKCYRARKTQLLLPGDSQRRTDFCTLYLDTLNTNADFSRNIIWTDESRISSDGIFNRNIHHKWADQNPHQQVNRVYQGRYGFNVWVALLDDRVLAYEIFEENLNSPLYLDIINRNVINYMDTIPLYDREKIYFQHDGAPAHNARNVVDCLNVNFGQQWIGNNGPIRWPARSPDLTPLDFFFWGYIKNKVYLNRTNTVEELRNRFETAVRELTNIHVRNSIDGVRKRCRLCLQNNGEQFEHLL